MRTIALRVRSTAVELENMGEDAAGAAESTSKLREQVMALTNVDGTGGVDIMLDENRYKGIYQILKEIAEVWDDIEDVDAAALLELLAGKNRSNVLAGLLRNFQDAESALNDALTAEGSAMAENEKYLNSIQGKLKQLEAAWQSLSSTILDSRLVKGLLDFAISIVTAIDKIIESVGILGAAISSIIAGVGIRSDILQVFKDINAGASVSTAAVIGLKQAMRSLAGAALILGAIKIAEWFYNTCISTEKAIKNIEQLNDEIGTLQQNEGNITSLGQRFQELARKSSRTAEEQQEFYDIQNKLHELMPSLNGYYDAQNNFILTEVDGVSDLIQKYQDLIGVKREALATSYFDENFFDNSPYKEDKYKMDRAQTILESDSLSKYKRLYSKEGYGDLSKLSWWDQMTKFAWADGEAHDYWNLWNTTYNRKAPELIESEQNQIYDTSMGSFHNALSSRLLSYKSVGRYKSTAEQNALLEALQGFSRSDLDRYATDLDRFGEGASQRIFAEISRSAVYKDIRSGNLDGLSPTARNAVVDLGGLDRANQLLEIYKEHQREITDENYQWTDGLLKSEVAAVEAYNAWVEAQKKGEDTRGNLSTPNAKAGDVDLTSYATHASTVASLGDAYAEFRENAKVSIQTLDELQDAFGTYSNEWNDLVTTLSSGDATVGDVKSALEDLASAYIDEKIALGEVNDQTKAHIQSMLESIGVANAEAVVEQALIQNKTQLAQQAIATATAKADEQASTEELNTAILQECELLGLESAVAQQLVQEINNSAIAKASAALGTSFREATQADIDKLIEEAKAANMAAIDIAKLQKIKSAKASVDDAVATGVWTRAAKAADQFLNTVDQELSNFKLPTLEIEYDVSGLDAVQSKVGSTTDKISSEFQSMYDKLQAMREANLISEEQYLQQLFELNQQYNRNNVSAYRQYAMEIFNGMKSMMSDRVSAQYDSQIASLESERAEAERYYDSLIDAEQDKLELLREQWETEEHLLKIEQARAELARAQQQKNVHVYREGQGFVWEADQEKVQDATATVNNALQEYDRYQKELAIEKRIDQLEELKEKVLESIDQQIEAARRAKEEALANLEELQFSAESFLKFLEMFGIEVDDKTLEMIKSFDLMAEQAKDALDDLPSTMGSVGSAAETAAGAVQGLASAINALQSKTITIDVITKHSVVGAAAGTLAGAGVSLAAQHADGVIGIPSDEWAITDEEGPELIIPGKGTFRRLSMGTSVLPADVSRNLWAIGQNPVGFASGIANWINNKKEDNKTYQVNIGDIILHEVQNARQIADELKGLVLKAEQLAYSK